MKKLMASGGVVALLSVGMVAVFSAPVHAASTYVVNTPDDENGPATDCTDNNPATTCSLREAVAAATADGDTIQLPENILTVSLGEITHGDTSLTIVGQGIGNTQVIAQPATSRILVQGTGTLTMQGFVVADAERSGAGSQDGGAVQAQGDVVLDGMSFQENTVHSDLGTARGGAVYAAGAITTNNSYFTANAASTGGGDAFHSYGGALFANTTVTIVDTRFFPTNGVKVFPNSADNGGAVWGETGVDVTRGTFSGNTGNGKGSAVGTNGNGFVDSSVFVQNTNTTGGVGGGVYAAGTLQLVDSSFEENTAGSGGAAYAGGSLSGTGLEVARNLTEGVGTSGGGLYAGTTLALGGSSVVDNLAYDDVFNELPGPMGGGIYAGGDVTVTASVVSGNVAKYNGTGGGIFSKGGTIELIESTVANNTAQQDPNTNSSTGGGVSAPRVVLRFATVAGNGAATGADIAAQSLRSSASVVAYASGGSACAVGATTSTGYSYDDDGSCGFTGAHDTSAGPDPRLGPLSDNGGPTQTMLPLAGSPLVDAIPIGSCPGCDTTDQRGVPRPQGSGYDIGAVEVIGGVAVSPRFTG